MGSVGGSEGALSVLGKGGQRAKNSPVRVWEGVARNSTALELGQAAGLSQPQGCAPHVYVWLDQAQVYAVHLLR